METKYNTTKIILGLAAAAAAGAAIGMLMAPEKGADLQKKLKDGASDWLTQLTSLIASGKEVAAKFTSNNDDLYGNTHSEN